MDEDYQATTNSCGVGECAVLGTIECINGKPTDTCTPAQPPAQVDNTCNLADDDCDGEVDEEYEVRENMEERSEFVEEQTNFHMSSASGCDNFTQMRQDLASARCRR